ncbi:MAG: acyl-CoA dehydrogenase C-terminal domain-containing protein [Alphaproteobacteria bacterium]|nr:acyl-CoA dehydrogenase C-terminal domain-containing protein [Alphaproteobacteria bacterium]MCB1551299.1 acyl-CoA dehydrogenase C-terminal domain-containing protein [Alphaproteobacteria bacterium]MCB9985411.1 acyl-CoA dehydrogenase C-terminal domain-containing protein [Micavibrio sp.]HPQ51230.1 acyl-CoA dehydrogenase C-terminal domain-containing protein [Alphaproteobacteria bacterium]HRK98188.1 acyl-CoA dehydrogenase C-terminal domain-containing protein [Alphaproteobacteria bacterium]
MPVYKAPLENMKFVLHDVLNAGQLSELPDYDQATPDMLDNILEEGAKICEDLLFPLNQSGDEEGCTFNNGNVRTPKGFIEAYKTFTQGGWTALSAEPKYGGMGMPHLWGTAMSEMICSANMSFGMYPGLSEGAYRALLLHGAEELKQTYLPKLITGEWSGTMCLTESHCGTDLGLIRTKAVPTEGNAYKITGTKIFISAGEHDLTENIIHLVLAKLPDAPEGAKGISLFIVPKFMPDTQTANHATCGSIEHKMGIKASSTCVMNFENSIGWLVGEPHKGLKAMFTMMNAARLGVGMQGLGIAEVSWQNGLAYAKDRLQMRALDGTKAPDKPADPIIVHPDIRKMLLTSKAFCEGARALSYWVGMNLDIAEKHPDAQKRQDADDLVALLTPIVKAYQTDMGFEVANHAIQIHGGHGYIREYGVEQYARDARIAMIYEGTNGIQALDLVGRKMGQNYGRLLRSFFHPVLDFIESRQDNEKMQEFIFPLAKAFAKLQQSSIQIALKGLKDPNEAGAASTDYLRLFALVAVGYMWAQMAEIAQQKLESGSTDRRTEFYQSKIKTARFYMERMLPDIESRFRMIMAGAPSTMDITESEFAA